MYADYHIHMLGHGERELKAETLELFIEAARKKGVLEIGVCDHSWLFEQKNYQQVYQDLKKWAPDQGLLDIGVDEQGRWPYVLDTYFALLKKAEKKLADIKICKGLEVDYQPGIGSCYDDYPVDYLMCSVHHVDGWGFDNPAYAYGYIGRSVDEMYRRYFEILREGVLTGKYQIVGHLDLIKVFGYKNHCNLDKIIEQLLKTIKKMGMAVEVNTSGLNKPARDFYPSRQILEGCRDLDIPLTFGSDAHCPEQIARYFEQAYDHVLQIGCKKRAVFRNKKMQLLDF